MNWLHFLSNHTTSNTDYKRTPYYIMFKAKNYFSIQIKTVNPYFLVGLGVSIVRSISILSGIIKNVPSEGSNLIYLKQLLI